jgi:hypothetical protein
MESQATITQPCAEGRVSQPGGGLADRVGISSGLGIQIRLAPPPINTIERSYRISNTSAASKWLEVM